MSSTRSGDNQRDSATMSTAQRNWQRTALRVRSMTRFRLLGRWTQAVRGDEHDAMLQGDERDATAVLETYERLCVLGVGGAAVVYLVRHRLSPQLFAMKVQSCPMQQPWSRRTFHARKEQYILQMLQHPFVSKLHEAFHDRHRLYLVLEYHHGGSLADIQAFCGGTLSEDAVKFYASEIVQALEYVHTMGFVYRDLKPQNVLVGADGHIRLTDFGVAREGLPVDLSRYYSLEHDADWANEVGKTQGTYSEDETTTHTTTTTTSISGEEFMHDDDPDAVEERENSSNELDEWEMAWSDEVEDPSHCLLGVDDRVRLRSNSFVGTVDYMPPEMIQQVSTQSSDVDWWALGCLLYELLYGVSPFRTSSESTTKQLFHRILVGTIEFPLFPRVSTSCKNLIRRLLRVDVRQRLGHCQGSTEIKVHAFFNGVSWAYHHREPPIRVQRPCPICMWAPPDKSVPFVDEGKDANEDDLAWCRWHQLPCNPVDEPRDCTCDGERYERAATPLSRLRALARSQSTRFAAFRNGNKSVALAPAEPYV